MFRKLAVSSALIAALGCAAGAAKAPQAKPAVAAASRGKSDTAAQGDSMLVCEWEKPIGSNIPEKVCREALKSEMDRMRTQDMMRSQVGAPARRD